MNIKLLKILGNTSPPEFEETIKGIDEIRLAMMVSYIGNELANRLISAYENNEYSSDE